MFDEEGQGGACGVARPAQHARDFGRDGFRSQTRECLDGFRDGLGLGFGQDEGVPVAGTGEEVGGTAQHVGGQFAQLVAVAQFDTLPRAGGIGAVELVAFFVDVRLLARLFAAEVEGTGTAVAPVADLVAAWFAAPVVHGPGHVVGAYAIQAACNAVEEVEGEIDAGQLGFGAFDDGGQATVEAGLCEGAGAAVDVRMDGFGLGVLARTVAAGEEADPCAFDFVAHDGPAKAVEVMALAQLREDAEFGAEGFTDLFGQGFGLGTGGEVGIGEFAQDAGELGGSLAHGVEVPGRDGLYVLVQGEQGFDVRDWGVFELDSEAHPVNVYGGSSLAAFCRQAQLDFVAVEDEIGFTGAGHALRPVERFSP